jgi:hypothetical protein
LQGVFQLHFGLVGLGLWRFLGFATDLFSLSNNFLALPRLSPLHPQVGVVYVISKGFFPKQIIYLPEISSAHLVTNEFLSELGKGI